MRIILFALVLAALPWPAAAGKIDAAYQYRLSDFSGPIPSLWASLAADEATGEIYSLDQREKTLQVFNGSGMLIHSFGEEVDLNGAIDIAPGDDGEFFLLYINFGGSALRRLDYRGTVLDTISLDLPAEFLPFMPTRFDYRDGSLYLADADSFRIVVVNRDGSFQKGYDLKAEVEGFDSREEDRKETLGLEINGFSVDSRGHIFFTVPTLFAAFHLPPDGALQAFGSAGSGPGKFGIVAGVAADRKGHIFVADRLRNVVLVFDRALQFITEFGGRGPNPQNLSVPNEIAVDSNSDLLYVSQAANQGVSVFQLIFR